MATTGIYSIQNKINNKVYLGSSIDIKKRWERHKNDLNNKKHVNQSLQKDWNEYGSGNFKFSVIKQCEESELKFIELEEIYSSWEELYNVQSMKDEIIYLIANYLKEKNKEFEIDYKTDDCANKKALNFNIFVNDSDNEKELYFSLRNLDYVKTEEDEEKYLKSSNIKNDYVSERNGELIEIEYFS